MICVDASVAVKWVLQEELAEQARALYADALAAREPIIAPPLLAIEVTNTLFRRTRTPEGLTLTHATLRLEIFLEHALETINPIGLHRHALALSYAFGLPAAYDAHYLALATEFDCHLWTDDRRLVRALAGRLPFVKLLSDYEPRA
ncbi:MAG: type II toxin-antitoxin system VapC family toxin [Thermomicrobiales bacterium]